MTVNFHRQPVLSEILRNHISGRYSAYGNCSRDYLRLAVHYARPSNECLRRNWIALIYRATAIGIIIAGGTGDKTEGKEEGSCSHTRTLLGHLAILDRKIAKSSPWPGKLTRSLGTTGMSYETIYRITLSSTRRSQRSTKSSLHEMRSQMAVVHPAEHRGANVSALMKSAVE
jgi:hypothetical protein